MTLLIPNLDRHFIHIKQYQDTNRTPRPGHASYASFNTTANIQQLINSSTLNLTALFVDYNITAYESFVSDD